MLSTIQHKSLPRRAVPAGAQPPGAVTGTEKLSDVALGDMAERWPWHCWVTGWTG